MVDLLRSPSLLAAGLVVLIVGHSPAFPSDRQGHTHTPRLTHQAPSQLLRAGPASSQTRNRLLARKADQKQDRQADLKQPGRQSGRPAGAVETNDRPAAMTTSQMVVLLLLSAMVAMSLLWCRWADGNLARQHQDKPS